MSNCGEEAFHRYYRTIYGKRWDELVRCMSEEPSYAHLTYTERATYHLDVASRITALELGAHPGEQILDMCAAPGGKTLIIADALNGEGRLVANERSRARRSRLLSTLDTYLPAEKRRIIEVTGHDATRWCLYERDAYDRILLDIPCSSERHVLHSNRALREWSSNRTKHLAVQAFSFLASALDVVKKGGLIVYATCALSPAENDDVIKKLIARRGERVEIIASKKGIGEKTELGQLILPDTADGSGPQYIAKIRRSS